MAARKSFLKAKMYHALLETIPYIVWLSDPDGQLVYVNPAWTVLTGQPVQEALGLGWLKYFHPEDAKAVFLKYEQHTAKALMADNASSDSSLSKHEEWRILNHEGNYRRFSSICTPILDEKGNVIQWVGANNDLTELRAAKKRIHKAELEKMQRDHLLEIARVSRINSLGEMAATLAHELNQPLAALNNYIQGSLRRLKKDPEKIKDIFFALELAAKETQRASKIIERARTFLVKGSNSEEKVNLHALIKESMDFLSADCKRLDIQVDYEFYAEEPIVIFDRIQLQQIIVNLVRNAMDAVSLCPHERRNVMIQTTETKRKVHVLISDTGFGIAPENIEKIFQPFFTTKKEGIGMGLAICSSLLEWRHGKLSLKKTDQYGTHFKLELPLFH